MNDLYSLDLGGQAFAIEAPLQALEALTNTVR